jgi:hypothetical protein
MTLQKLIILFVSLCGGALGLFAPIGFVKWLLQTEPEDAGILTLSFVPVWCLLLVPASGAWTLNWPLAGIAPDWRQAAPCSDSGSRPVYCGPVLRHPAELIQAANDMSVVTV